MFLLLLALPLLLCALGLYGVVIRELDAPTSAQQLMVGLACLFPALILMVTVFWFESRSLRVKERRAQRKTAQKRYARQAPFNNGEGLASGAYPTPILHKGVTISDISRPVNMETIQETLERLRKFGKKTA